jgi:hypothetical protein
MKQSKFLFTKMNSKSELSKIAATIFILTVSTATASAQEAGAPLHLALEQGRTAALYLPEIDTQSGTAITARSAFSVTQSKGTPVFGAARFSAQAVVDNKAGRATLSQFQVDDVKLPEKGGDPAAMQEDLNAALNGVVWVTDSARFEQKTANAQNNNAPAFSTKPPKIYYEEIPSVLVFIDGEPILKATKDGQYKIVENTAYFIVYSPQDKCYFMKGGKWWFRSTDIRKNWIQVSQPPEGVLQLSASVFNAQDQETDENISDLKSPPKIVVTTEPAEIIVVNGAPEFVSVEGTSLLYVDNTESNILMDVNSQKYYVLIAGRWYAAPSLSKGPWSFVPPDRLPNDFAAIPQDSGARDVRASVAGTSEAEEAQLDAAVPEVAAVDRNSASVSVNYDGTPSFVTVAGTKVRYAANANVTVLQINNRFYAVDNGIWFESALPVGPWVVTVSVPSEVQDIPPSSPVYNVRYVYVYDYTPDVVYVGYTSGYFCSYAYDGTVVYGTGYYYHPWHGSVYYGYPVTYGFGVHYNPYVGFWGYPVGVSFGWIGFGLAVAPFGFWGPAGYVYGYRHGYYHHDRHGYYHGYHNGYEAGHTAGRHPGYRAVPHGRPASASLYENKGRSIRNVNSRQHTISSASSSRIARNRPSFNNSSFQTEPKQNSSLGRSGTRYSNGSMGNRPLRNAQTPKVRSFRGSSVSTNPSTQVQGRPTSKQGFRSQNRTTTRIQPYNHVVQPATNGTRTERSSSQKPVVGRTQTKSTNVEHDVKTSGQKKSFSTSGTSSPSSSGFHFNRSNERPSSYRSSAPSPAPSHRDTPSHQNSGGSSFSGSRGRRH